MVHDYLYIAYRDGFHGRDPASVCQAYMDAWTRGLRASDRTRASLVARAHTANASAVFPAPAADVTPNGSRKRCVRCDELGFLEEHHWAPREIFGEEAELFPTDLLCQKCHSHWHAKMNEPRVRRW